MSILIKGMEMPTNCFYCPLSVLSGERLFCKVTKDEVVRAKRSSDCPLVPVPVHGDLIDQDAYRDEFMDGVYALCNDDPDNYRANAIIDLFDLAPTIIPADPAEEGET